MFYFLSTMYLNVLKYTKILEEILLLIVLEFAQNNSLSFHGLVSGLIAFLGVRVFLPKSHVNG